jgi:hypothetical protein
MQSPSTIPQQAPDGRVTTSLVDQGQTSENSIYPTFSPYQSNDFLVQAKLTGTILRVGPKGTPRWSADLGGCLAAQISSSPGSTRAAILGYNSSKDEYQVLLLDEAAGQPTVTVLRTFTGASSLDAQVRLSADGTRAAVMTQPKTHARRVARIEVLDATGKSLETYTTPEGMILQSWAADAGLHTLVLGLSSASTVGAAVPAGVVELYRDSSLVRSLTYQQPVLVDVSPDGKSLAIALPARTTQGSTEVQVLSADTGTVRWTKSLPGVAASITYVADGQLLLGLGSQLPLEGQSQESDVAEFGAAFLSAAEGQEVWSDASVTSMFATTRFARMFAFWSLSEEVSFVDFEGDEPMIAPGGAGYSDLTLSNDGTASLAVDDTSQISAGPWPSASGPARTRDAEPRLHRLGGCRAIAV